MTKKQLWEKAKAQIINILAFIVKINPLTKPRLIMGWVFIRKSWKSIAIILPVFLILYYAIGSWATNNINKSIDVEINQPLKGLAVVDTMAGLIKREVDDKMWTPNLPVVFPGYVLDNMPQYQQGIIHSLKVTSKALARNYSSENLDKASQLLAYPSNIWLLSKTENLALAPSSGAQYRKARKALQRFNEETMMPKGNSGEILKNMLSALQKSSGNISLNLEKQVRENATNWLDFQADNVFYLSQGKMYGSYLILKSLAEDFKPQILQAGQYEAWTSLCKTLEDGFGLNPSIVRNGSPDSSVAPNHLIALNYYVTKFRYQLSNLIAALDVSNK